MGDQVLAIGAEDTTVSVVEVGVLELLSGRSVELDAFGSDCLPGGKSESASLHGVGRSHELSSVLVSDQVKSLHLGQRILTSALASAMLVRGSGYLRVSSRGYRGQAATWTCSPREAA